MSVAADLFPGSAERPIRTGAGETELRTSGHGRLLLHGHPQAQVCRHKIAAELARHCPLTAAGESRAPLNAARGHRRAANDAAR